MASKPTFKAIHKQSGNVVTVYKHISGTFIDFADCETEYKKSELEIQK
jgi:hypothetical protein